MLVGHDTLTGSLSHGWPDYELCERELGARAALALGDPEQWFWEIYAERIKGELERDDTYTYANLGRL